MQHNQATERTVHLPEGASEPMDTSGHSVRKPSVVASKVSANGSALRRGVAQRLRSLRQKRQSHSPVNKGPKIHTTDAVKSNNVVSSKTTESNTLKPMQASPDTTIHTPQIEVAYGQVNTASPSETQTPTIALGLRLLTTQSNNDEEEEQNITATEQDTDSVTAKASNSETPRSRSRWFPMTPRRHARARSDGMPSTANKVTGKGKSSSNELEGERRPPRVPHTPSSVFASMISIASPRISRPRFNWSKATAENAQATGDSAPPSQSDVIREETQEAESASVPAMDGSSTHPTPSRTTGWGFGRLVTQMRSPKAEVSGSGGGGASLNSHIRDMIRTRRQAINGDD
jgi:hypothetical protein